MTKTPASLLERLRSSFDADAWTRFVALYTPLIYSWGRRVGLQDQDAVDLVQDVFATLIQVLPTFTYDQNKSFRRWLRTRSKSLVSYSSSGISRPNRSSSPASGLQPTASTVVMTRWTR